MCRATISPGNHLKSDFKKEAEIAENFSIEVDFLIMREVKVFTCWKREIPEKLRIQLADSKYFLADPEQINTGSTLLYIHGILGVREIQQMNRQKYNRVPNSEMTICRSNFGDLLFGTSHYINHTQGSNPVPLDGRDEDEFGQFSNNTQSICSMSLRNSGLQEELVESQFSLTNLNDVEDKLKNLQE